VELVEEAELVEAVAVLLPVLVAVLVAEAVPEVVELDEFVVPDVTLAVEEALEFPVEDAEPVVDDAELGLVVDDAEDAVLLALEAEVAAVEIEPEEAEELEFPLQAAVATNVLK